MSNSFIFAFISCDQKTQSASHLSQRRSHFALDVPRRVNVACFEKGAVELNWTECLGPADCVATQDEIWKEKDAVIHNGTLDHFKAPN